MADKISKPNSRAEFFDAKLEEIQFSDNERFRAEFECKKREQHARPKDARDVEQRQHKNKINGHWLDIDAATHQTQQRL